jgi:hypothetical protein
MKTLFTARSPGQLAESLPETTWQPLRRLARYELATEPRCKPPRIKEAIVRFKGSRGPPQLLEVRPVTEDLVPSTAWSTPRLSRHARVPLRWRQQFCPPSKRIDELCWPRLGLPCFWVFSMVICLSSYRQVVASVSLCVQEFIREFA